ncbi:MAG: FtsW/RodA/SpoVE family cell cycle protein, partial [Hyphomicrobiaceae bacterium]
SRTDRSTLAAWWFTVDRQLLIGILVLLATGIIFSLAASPTVALKKGLAPYTYVERHILFAGIGTFLVLAISFLPPMIIRRISLVLFVSSIALIVGVLFFGPEINGARRWVRFLGQSLQPSEFLKPAFIILMAWCLAEHARTGRRSLLLITMIMLACVVALLILQPDLGQSLIFAILWGGLFFAAGYSLLWPLAAAGLGTAAIVGAYRTFPHVRSRFDGFFRPDQSDTYQIDRAVQSFVEGGWFGRGPGEGVIKSILPDAHTDFILAVIAEEFGIAVCLVLIGLFGFVIVRALQHTWRMENLFARNAAAGFTVLLATQTFANMGVNTGLLPAKGVTLPFISYGGSSLIAMSIAMGMLVALTRRSAEINAPALPNLRPHSAPKNARFESNPASTSQAG